MPESGRFVKSPENVLESEVGGGCNGCNAEGVGCNEIGVTTLTSRGTRDAVIVRGYFRGENGGCNAVTGFWGKKTPTQEFSLFFVLVRRKDEKTGFLASLTKKRVTALHPIYLSIM